MAHPMRKAATEGHNDKLRRMTEHYGAASGPENNIPAETNRLKTEGPEDDVGFGAEARSPRARADRPSRRTTAANPVSTYAKGGAVSRARGGRAKHKGTHVNVIVAPQGGGGAPPMPPPVIPVGGPPVVPPAAAPVVPRVPMGGPPMAGMPMAPGAPGGLPPGIMPPRAKGGRVHRHADEAEDKALIEKTLRDEGLVRSDKPAKVRARGGRIEEGMTAGAASGPGRLEKVEMREKNARHEKPQAV